MTMLRVEDMPAAEMHALLVRGHFCHLGCARNGRPYVVPMNYACDGETIYFFTTEGMKTDFIKGNPQVCLQVEEIIDSSHWTSVMVTGHAERLTEQQEIEHAMQCISERNPTLTPAISQTQLDIGGRPNTLALYRVCPDSMDGRKTR
jgi:nitroimidazol reductase NimA-like FMN-containing flavoprotein (pyridoxamine 5'-phosphate oxidase superfamily)